MLNINATPAEVARGCRFAERFVDPIAVAKNRGTVVGAVPIRYPKGAIFPGTAGNYITYPVESLLNKLVLNFVIEFTPFFASDDNLNHFFFDTTNGQRIQVVKGTLNTIYVWSETAGYILTALAANVLANWKTNQRNVLVVSMISGTNAMILNDTSIITSVVAWTATNPATMYVGSRFSNEFHFNGYMHSLKVFTGNVAADLLTQQEAINYYRRDI